MLDRKENKRAECYEFQIIHRFIFLDLLIKIFESIRINEMSDNINVKQVKGMASADKKAGRIAAEGAIGSYIHTGSRLGVLAEINCETDFVARGDLFKELVEDLCMQIAACPDVEYVREEDIPKVTRFRMNPIMGVPLYKILMALVQ